LAFITNSSQPLSCQRSHSNNAKEKSAHFNQRDAQTIADVLGEEGFARSLSKADLEYLFSED
jgi:hypothetical protein